MTGLKLTDDNVRKLTVRAKDRRKTRPGTEWRDTVQRGLVVRCWLTGKDDKGEDVITRTFTVTYTVPGRNSKGEPTHHTRRVQLARVGEITVKQARDRAEEVRAKVRLGADPAREIAANKRRKDAATLNALAKEFLKAKPRKRGGEWRAKSYAGFESAFRLHLLPKFGYRDPAEITRGEVRAFIQDLAKRHPVGANRVLAALRRLYNWTISMELIDKNPTLGIERPGPEKKRTKTYTDDELRALATGLKDTRLDHLFQLVLRTATRDSETRSARWCDLDLDRSVWTIPPEAAKTGEVTGAVHRVPLSAGAVKVLREIKKHNLKAGFGKSEFLFPAATETGYVGLPAKLARNRGLRLRDVRRTVADRLQHDLGVPAYIVHAILGHSQSGLAQVYMPSGVGEDPVRAALKRWSDALDKILAPRRDRRRARA